MRTFFNKGQDMSECIEIKIKYIDKKVPELKKINIGNWIDLSINRIEVLESSFSYIEDKVYQLDQLDFVHLVRWDFIKVYFGIAMELPEGYEAHVKPRSSTFRKYGLIQTNGVGVIDTSYCGDNDEWFAPMLVLKQFSLVKKYTRVCQFRIVPEMPNINLVKVDSLDNPDRNGDGSTGD